MSCRLEEELKELVKEEERQKLLDALSESHLRNTELEIALAKLARDQDRIAILERERILKRAQVAQATAAMVHEANWARTRLESEMRQSKLRAMVFPEPAPLSPQLVFPEAIIAAPQLMSSTSIFRDAKEKQTSSRREEPSSEPSLEHPKTICHAPSESSSRQADIPVEMSPKEQIQPPRVVAPMTQPDISDMVYSAATNVYDNLTSYVRASIPFPIEKTEGNDQSSFPEQLPDRIPNEKAQDTYPRVVELAEEKLPAKSQESVAIPPRPSEPANMPPVPRKVLFVPPPITKTQPLKAIPDSSSKGLWTNSQLLTEAEVTMMAMNQEDILWDNHRRVLEKHFGIPPLIHERPTQATDDESIKAQEYWTRVAGKRIVQEEQSKIDRVNIVAEKAGIDPRILDNDHVENELPESQPLESQPPKTLQTVQLPEHKVKKKKGCMIM